MKQRFDYLVTVQFLGFRYHGWQKQPQLKTVEHMITKTLRYILKDTNRYRIIGASRTDAMVSALDAAFELFLYNEPLKNIPDFIEQLNANLPSDIKVTEMNVVHKDFNIIQSSKLKEYVYLFSYGEKNHPYAAPFIANIQDSLNIELMKEAALLFEGTHCFKAYCGRANNQKVFTRTINTCELTENSFLNANFFPKQSYALKVSAKGFLRYQIRLMMGALIQLGRGKINQEFIQKSLEENNNMLIDYIAPASGLHLKKLMFNE